MRKEKKIALIGDPILRKTAKTVQKNEISKSYIQDIIQELIDTVRSLNGAGLAANQIFYPYRICVIEMINNNRYKNFPAIPLKVLVNPVINILDDAKIFSSYEGCLSVPNMRGKVDRYSRINVTYYDEKGIFNNEIIDGIPAIVYQHEIDHLNGYLFTDKIKDNKTLVTYENFVKYYESEYVIELEKFINSYI